MFEMRRHEDHKFAPNNPKRMTECSKIIAVKQDGERDEVLRLNCLNDRDREEIVKEGFMNYHNLVNYKPAANQPKYKVVGRDNPWDFEIIENNGNKLILEIRRIGDERLLAAMKAENECSPLFGKRKLRGHELRKLARNYPEVVSGKIERIVKSLKTREDNDKLFDLVYHVPRPRGLVSLPITSDLDVAAEIRKAIQAKADKPHPEKDRVHLIIDNLTTHSQPIDVDYASGRLEEFIDQSPFPSIYLYTGYGFNTITGGYEYSIFPLKLSEREEAFMSKIPEAVRRPRYDR